jgi:ATP-binding cassette, subfamily C, bacteriocin exporter
MHKTMKEVTVKQRDMTDCGAACLASVAGYFNLYIPVSRIRQLASTDKKGTNVLGLIEAATTLGFDAKGVKGVLDSLSKIPKPAIAHVVIDQVLHHYVVIYKVDQTNVTIMDPRDGLLHVKAFPEFAKIWSGVLILLQPNENFTPGNLSSSLTKKLVALLRPHKTAVAQALIAALIYTVIGLSTAIYIQKIVDYVLVEADRQYLTSMSFAMIMLLLVQIFAGVIKGVFTLRTGQRIDGRLILGYYQHLLQLPQRFFDSMRIGEITSRINDAVKIRTFINDTSINVMVNIFVIVFSSLLMFTYLWKIAAVVLLMIPAYAVLYYLINALNKKVERKLMENAAHVDSELVESITAIKTIKSFGLEDYAHGKTRTKFGELLKSVNKSGMNSIFSNSITEFISKFFTIIVLWLGAGLVLDTAISPGELLSFYALLNYFTTPMSNLMTMNKSLQNALIAGDRLFEIMELERDTVDGKITLTKDVMGDLEFRNVSFRYGSRVNVFRDLCVRITRGATTAIIGESGSGKSTLIAILQRLYPIQAGAVYIGEVNIQTADLSSLRKLISVVPQKVDLFSGTVIDNIAVGQPSPDIQKVMEVSRLVGINLFIENLPNGYNTYLGENGSELSGGQRQRLAIARALYKNPEVLIFDEATSSLDVESEIFFYQLITSLQAQGKTIVVVTHRLQSVIHFDKIILLSAGNVEAAGSHTELLNSSDYYRKLWLQQVPSHVIQDLAKFVQ